LKILGYNIDLEKAVKTINEKKYKHVVLQVPEGLKSHVYKFVEFLEKNTDSRVIISGDPCFGACDVGRYELRDLKIDFIVQIGHLPIPYVKNPVIPMVFINAEADVDVTKIVEKAIPYLKGEKIGLATTAQHVHLLDEISNLLRENNFKPVIGEGDRRIFSKGQILGCNFSAARCIADCVDLFMFVGSGSFHPLGLLLSTRKPVITCDPYTNEVKSDELEDLKDMILRQRYGAIARSKDAKVFGILVGIKKGQQRIELVNKIKNILDSNHKKSYVIALDYFSPMTLESFREIDCFVSTACPRIAIDDYMQYETPIVTPVELEILLGIKKWDEYQFDEIR